jgi:Aspartyl/Asparaginyl beta-hydroxylase
MRRIEAVGWVDVQEVVGEVGERERQGLFDAIRIRQEVVGGPHKDTRAIFLRGPAMAGLGLSGMAEAWMQEVRCVAYPAMKAWWGMARVLQAVWGMVGRRGLGKVMVVELKAGGSIGWHIDEGGYAQGYERYHVAIRTNPYCWLYSGGEAGHVPVGAVVKFDTSVLHSAANFGTTPRWHLIVDVAKAKEEVDETALMQ